MEFLIIAGLAVLLFVLHRLGWLSGGSESKSDRVTESRNELDTDLLYGEDGLANRRGDGEKLDREKGSQ